MSGCSGSCEQGKRPCDCQSANAGSDFGELWFPIALILACGLFLFLK